MTNINLKDKIIIKCLRDPEFKKQLHNNPKEAILAIAKETLDKDKLEHLQNMRINVIDEKKDEITIVLPHIPTEKRAKVEKLSDEELAMLAAGNLQFTLTCYGC
ncbi:MAG: hypothetical protein PVI75_00850 [Gammaproteobacteria bacterium]